MAKLKIELNDPSKIQDLLQQAYNLSDEQITQSQNEINKLSNASKLSEEPMEARTKYAKAVNDYLAIKDKAISKKIEIAKLMSEILQHGGNLSDEGEGGYTKGATIDFTKIKEMVKNGMSDGNDRTKTIELNKK